MIKKKMILLIAIMALSLTSCSDDTSSSSIEKEAMGFGKQHAEPLNSAQKDRRAITSYLESIKMYMEVFYADNEKYPSAKELRDMPEAQEPLNKLLAISEISVDSSNASLTYTIIAKSIKNPKVIVRVSP